MSRTDAHTPWWVAEDDIPWSSPGRGYRRHMLGMTPLERQQWWDSRPEWKRIRKHLARPSSIHWFQKQENRKSRRRARVALYTGDYDSLPTHETGRHNARWLAY